MPVQDKLKKEGNAALLVILWEKSLSYQGVMGLGGRYSYKRRIDKGRKRCLTLSGIK
jgi:hypothetical protein